MTIVNSKTGFGLSGVTNLVSTLMDGFLRQVSAQMSRSGFKLFLRRYPTVGIPADTRKTCSASKTNYEYFKEVR